MITASPNMATAIESVVQHPSFKLLSYDISSQTGETWGSIIEGTAAQIPVNLTSFASDISWSYDRMTVTLADDIGRFHPDTGDLAVALCPGHGIRLTEGDVTVPEDQWLFTFSGIIQGPYTWSTKRGNISQAKFSVFPRNANKAWQQRNITSQEFTIGTDWSLMFYDVVKTQMSMTDAEIDISKAWSVIFDKSTNQIVNTPAWESLQKLIQGNYERLWFNGRGQISSYPFTLDRVTKILPDDTLINNYAQNGSDTEIINKVSVTYIDNVLSKVTGARSTLGTANVTAGFFDLETRLDVFYSDDKKQRADNVELIVKNSINQNDLGIAIGSERLDIKDEFGGELIITVDAYVSALATAGLAAIISASFLGDNVVSLGAGVTVTVGRIVEAAGVVAVMVAMMILGTGIYEIVGTPFEMACLEKKAIALRDNVLFWEVKEKEIRNEFISTEDHAHLLALNELLFEQSLQHPRSIIIQNDPRIEPGDILQLANGVKFYVQSASKRLSRGTNSQMTLTGFRSIV